MSTLFSGGVSFLMIFSARKMALNDLVRKYSASVKSKSSISEYVM
jgi:hypothetical protein